MKSQENLRDFIGLQVSSRGVLIYFRAFNGVSEWLQDVSEHTVGFKGFRNFQRSFRGDPKKLKAVLNGL